MSTTTYKAPASRFSFLVMQVGILLRHAAPTVLGINAPIGGHGSEGVVPKWVWYQNGETIGVLEGAICLPCISSTPANTNS